MKYSDLTQLEAFKLDLPLAASFNAFVMTNRKYLTVIHFNSICMFCTLFAQITFDDKISESKCLAQGADYIPSVAPPEPGQYPWMSSETFCIAKLNLSVQIILAYS